MSSHREAPEISQDPVADNTDVYAFVSPDRPNTVTFISNFIPLEAPAGGPNFYEFGEDVLYKILIDNNGDSRPDIEYVFRFTTQVRNPDTFLYNTGPIDSIDSPNWNRPQFYSVSRRTRRHGDDWEWDQLGRHLPSPPCNVGVRSTPDYASLADEAIHEVDDDIVVFAGQRQEGFFVDLGSIFDLGALRPFQNLHLIPLAATPGVNGTQGTNVHTMAIQVPIRQLTRDGSRPTNVNDPRATIGVYAAAYRRKVKIRQGSDPDTESGPWVQVSRLGNPLFNEVIVPMGDKDLWNAVRPAQDKIFAEYVAQPELARLLPVLYPGVFPNLAGLTADRADLDAILLTGIPEGIVPGFQNFTGPVKADLLRLNMAVPPASNPSIYGILDGDLAGFPNGRRVSDDVVAIELRAVAGVTYPLVDPSYTPDAAAAVLTDGTDSNNGITYLDEFPYLGHPLNGFDNP